MDPAHPCPRGAALHECAFAIWFKLIRAWGWNATDVGAGYHHRAVPGRLLVSIDAGVRRVAQGCARAIGSLPCIRTAASSH
jgi:hypothetical protein